MARPRKRKIHEEDQPKLARKTRSTSNAEGNSKQGDTIIIDSSSKSRNGRKSSVVKVETDTAETEALPLDTRKRKRISSRKCTDEVNDDATSSALGGKTTQVNHASDSNRVAVNGVAKKPREVRKKVEASVTPRLTKQESETALAALGRIAAMVHHEESDGATSDDSLENVVPTSGQHKKSVANGTFGQRSEQNLEGVKHEEDEEDEDDDDLFEDVDISARAGASSKFDVEEKETSGEDLNLTLEKVERIQLAKTGKKKQSVRAVHERAFCHYMSTIAMVAIGAWRNKWLSDPKLQRILRKLMRARANALHRELKTLARNKNTTPHEFVELVGRVMKVFSKQFKRTKPGLRKLGHRHVAQMDAGTYVEEASEKFKDVKEFLTQAKSLSGSRDYGAQLFTALLRAYHFRARLVFSTQPLGFKFNEREEFNADLVQSIKEETERRTKSQSGDQHMQGTTEDLRDIKDSKAGSKDNAISIDDSDLSELDSEYSIDPDLLSDVEDLTKTTKESIPVKERRPDDELEFPIFWTELYDFTSDRWIAIDAMVKEVVLVEAKDFKSLHPRGAKAEQQKLTLGFVVAYDANRHAKDVTMRYASSWAKVKEVFLRADGKTNTRYDVNKILVSLGNPYRDELERREDDLLAFKEVVKPPVDEMPKTLADFKSSPKYILDKHLREKESFKPGAKAIDTFSAGKGAKATSAKVYLRADVIAGKTIENYHKEGRQIKAGERPIKMIKARAMTTNRIREHQQQLAETGEEHVMQGIYSIDQTEYIIPPPIKNGIIPKNAYGNADVFVESMIPEGATHLKLKGASRIARKLEIEHAEAVVGFEFKARGAIPVVLGVLVANENAERLRDAWQEAEEIRIRKEDKKRSDAALKLWAKLLKGMRIRRRINAEYGIPDREEVDDDGEMYKAEEQGPPTLSITKVDDLAANENDHDDESLADGGFIRE